MLSNKVAIVTGGAGFLGREIVKQLAKQGATVVVFDRAAVLNQSAKIENATLVKPVDLLSVDDTNRCVKEVCTEMKKIDVLINTAGGFMMGAKSYEEGDEYLNHFKSMMDINVHTMLNATHAVLPLFVQQKYGKVVNVAARPAFHGVGGMGAYSASKAVVVNFTQSIADEVKSFNVNVNAVCPSVIDTPANRAAMPNSNFDDWVKPESLADVICFLSSDQSRDMHGNALQVYNRA